MNTENLVRIESIIGETYDGCPDYLAIKAHESVKGENPFKCDNIKLNGKPIEGREFNLTVFDTLIDNETGLTYKFSVSGNVTRNLTFPQILTFRNDVQISESLALPSSLMEMSLKPSTSYLNMIMYNFGQHIFFNLLKEYVGVNKYELRSVGERYPFEFIPIATDTRIFTDGGYVEIQTYHNGNTVEYADHGLRLIKDPTYIICVEHPYSKLNIDRFYSYEPEPLRFRELTVDTSKSMYEPAKILEELTKDMINL